MILHNDGEYETEEKNKEEAMSPSKDGSDVEEVGMGKLMPVVKRALNMKLKEEAKMQRENIFHTKCYISDKVCGMIIDEGSCTYIVIMFLVRKLGLKTTRHPRPYKLQWLMIAVRLK